MKCFQFKYNQNFLNFILLLLFNLLYPADNKAFSQVIPPAMQYIVSMPDPGNHYFHVELYCSGPGKDTIDFKMPEWMPGYYQIMNYGRAVENFVAKDNIGKSILINKIHDNTWQIVAKKNKPFYISYDVKADRKFVANSYIDSTHAYIVPCSMFLYIDGFIKTPVRLKINNYKDWSKIATGLESVPGKKNEFTAPDFDILYDCPLLIGNLEELPSFKVNGIEHRFIGYKMGNFDRTHLMSNLKKVVEAAVNIIGDIPYKQYTFIAIGPGRGGIEHLNNCTVSFDGSRLDTKEGMNTMMNFLAHEYFHNYNIKRIRPFELGPFDYGKENRTNLLWVSEGLSVYYEYMVVKRAGLADEQALFSNFENNINAFENNPGRFYQSLTQASYETWSDGPFGKQGEDANKAISYYDKGPVVGMLLDFAIRHDTKNNKSLDDVFRLLYWKYYKGKQRGFTDAEFQEACESISGKSLAPLFEYVYTTKEPDYNAYLAYAGLKIKEETNPQTGKRKFTITRLDKIDPEQSAILQTWLGE